MLFKQRIIILLALCFFTAPLYAAEQRYKVSNIFDHDTLNIRKGPSVKTPIISSLPYNAKNITIIQTAPHSTWVKISVAASDTSGWVNSRYLTRYSTMLPTAYSCSGTEPFWRVAIDTKTRKITAHALSDSNHDFNVPLKLNTHAMNSPPESRIITGNNAQHDITAFIIEGSCSDGMSGKVFAYHITTLIDQKAYRGCCDAVAKISE